MSANKSAPNERKTTWKIYWWTKTDGGIKRGIDVVTIEGDAFNESDADNILDNVASQTGDFADKGQQLKNFANSYLSATHCLDFGVTKVKQVKEQ